MVVALPWLVLESSGSPSQAAIVLALEASPYVLLGAVAGAVADGAAPGRVLALGHTVQGLLAMVIPAWSALGHPPMAVLLVMPCLVGAARVFPDAATMGAVAGIVGPGRFVDGQSSVMAAWSVGMLLGSAAGGLLVAAIGPGRSLAVEAGCYVLAGVLAGRVQVAAQRAPRMSLALLRTTVREGVAAVRTSRALTRLTAVGVCRGLCVGGLMALLVALLRDGYEYPSALVGSLVALGALAGLVVTPAIGDASRRFGERRLIGCGLAVTSSAALLLAAGPKVGLVGAALACLYGGQFITTSTLTGARQHRAAENLQARVGMISRSFDKGSWVVGALVSGALASWAGMRATYAILGAGMAALAGVVLAGTVRHRSTTAVRQSG